MGDTIKRIKFEAVKDNKTFKDLEKSMSDLSFKWSDNIKTELKRVKQLQYEIKELSQQFEAIENLKGKEFDALRKELQKEIDLRKSELGKSSKDDKQIEAQKDLQTIALAKLESWSKEALNGLKTVFANAWDELSDIVDYSRLSSSNTRNLAFTYGFNSSQAYGYSQAMSMMGFQSEEDLMYATSEELASFKQLFQKYTNWYEDVGKEELDIYREFEIEMAEFKKDMNLTVVDFFLKNKDEIKQFIEFGFEVGQVIMDSLGWLITYFGGEKTRTGSEKTADAATILSNWSNTSTVNKNNFNNTFSIQADSQSAGRNIANDFLLSVQKAFGGT